MTLKGLLKFFLRFFRNLSIKIPIIYNLFLKLEDKRAPNTEFFASKSWSINMNILYAQNKFSNYLDLIRKSDENFKLKNKRVLEIGPGDTRIHTGEGIGLSIAKLINIPLVQIYITARYKKWMDFRKELIYFIRKCNNGILYQPLTHPDLQYFPNRHGITVIT